MILYHAYDYVYAMFLGCNGMLDFEIESYIKKKSSKIIQVIEVFVVVFFSEMLIRKNNLEFRKAGRTIVLFGRHNNRNLP